MPSKGCSGIGVLGGLLSYQPAFSHPLHSFPPGGPEWLLWHQPSHLHSHNKTEKERV